MQDTGQPATILEHENALLQWALSVPTNQLLQHLKLGNLGKFEYAIVQSGLTLIDGLRTQEKIEGLDLNPAKQYVMEIVLDHSILSVGRDGFGFKMARSQFAETKQTYTYDNPNEEEKQGVFDNFKAPNIPKPNDKHYKLNFGKKNRF
jgi:hypothetical protein|tara:strand:- start:36 stop:479 length:444 start_codon:yes stop_codon:yes gene_type:complete